MFNCKRGVISSALIVLCLLTGLTFLAWSPAFKTQTVAATPLDPDLVIESVIFSPEAPSIGNTLTFTITITNLGEISAGSSQLTCTIDGLHLATKHVEGIEPGMTVIKTMTWKAQAGPHVLQVIIDSENSVTESDEANNDKSCAFTVVAPDLAIDAISWMPVNPAAGEKITFTVTVINQGDKRAGTSHLEFTVDGRPRGYCVLLGIDAGASVNETFTWVTVSGLHHIRASVDVLQQVIESDEKNNSSEATCATALPDLIINSLSFSPEYPSEGDEVILTVTVKNQDSGRAEPSSLAYYVDDVLRESTVIGYLNYGDTTTANFTWTAGTSPHTFKLVADAYNIIEESDETNNILVSPSPSILPDLIIQDITWTPASPLLYSYVTTTITIKNQGTCESYSTRVKFGVDTIHQYTSMIPALPPGATTTVKFMWFTLYESHTLEALVDDENYVKESDESNNVLIKTITSTPSTPSADLIPETITISPSMPVFGETATISVKVKNQGTGTAPASYASIYLDGHFADTVFINELTTGATLVKDIILHLDGLPFKDTYKISVLLDYKNIVWESDELNNDIETSFSTLAPDLTIQSIRWSPEVPTAGDSIIFDVIVKNHGSLKAESTYISYYVNKVSMGRHLIEDIEAGASVTRSFTCSALTGTYSFTAKVDEDGQIIESDESNNTRTLHLPAPDLFIDSITWTSENPFEFSPVTFTAVIGNRGYGQSDNSLLSCYIDGTETLTFDTGDISPGGTSTVVFKYAFASGEHSIRMVADSNDAITESDEANNEKTAEFLVKGDSMNISLPTPGSTHNATSQLSTPDSTIAVPTTENLTSLNQTMGEIQDIAANITTSQSKWQEILLNRWLLIGVAALGIALIGGLLLYRKKASKS